MKGPLRKILIPLIAVLLGGVVIAAVALLQQRSDAAGAVELKLAGIETQVNKLQQLPTQAVPGAGGSLRLVKREMARAKAKITTDLAALRDESPPASLAELPAVLDANYVALTKFLDLISGAGLEKGAVTPPESEGLPPPSPSDGSVGFPRDVQAAMKRTSREAFTLLGESTQAYDDRAASSRLQATIGSAAAILALLAAFGFIYRRASALARQNDALLATSRAEALTDALTGLNNRRAFLNDLDAVVVRADGAREQLLATFDLDGFKQYNDTFGHPAGDDLLVRLSGRLRDAVSGKGHVYRMGGDEFCFLGEVTDGDRTLERAARALSERDESFAVTCSLGSVLIPSECADAESAMQLCDQRMYAHKAAHHPDGRRSSDGVLRMPQSAAARA